MDIVVGGQLVGHSGGQLVGHSGGQMDIVVDSWT